jgi:hypothetical protein
VGELVLVDWPVICREKFSGVVLLIYLSVHATNDNTSDLSTGCRKVNWDVALNFAQQAADDGV